MVLALMDIPLFSDIWILGYHGYLNITDTWIPWIVRYHGKWIVYP